MLRKYWKRFWTAALGFAGLVVIALNIERLAKYLGLDKALLAVASNLPIGFQSVWSALKSPTALILAIVAVAYSAGLFTEAFFRWLEFGRHKPLDRQALAYLCRSQAEIVRANARFMGEKQGHAYYIRLQTELVERRIERALNVRIDISPIDMDTALAAVNFLEDAAMLIEQDQIDALRKLANGFKVANHGPQAIV